MHTSLVLYSTIFALSMERTWFTFHCWLYNLCIVVYVTNKAWNLKLETSLNFQCQIYHKIQTIKVAPSVKAAMQIVGESSLHLYY